MKSFSFGCALFIIVAVLMYSCKEPADDIPPAPVDHLASYDRIDVENNFITGLSAFGIYKSFIIDSSLFLVSSGTSFLSLEMIVVDLEGYVQSRSTFYTSAFQIGGHPIFDKERNLFYFVGEVYDETPFPYSNPLFLVIDLQGNLLNEKKYVWEGRYNGFNSILIRPGHNPVLVAYDRVGSMGHWGLDDEKLILMDNNYDSIIGIRIRKDSCYYNYMDFKDENTIRVVGTKQDSVNVSTVYEHKFYGEIDLGGFFTDDYRLDGLNTGHLRIHSSDPMNFYSWTKTGPQGITWKKYSQEGSLITSSDYSLLPVPYPAYDFALTFVKDAFSDQNILYGYFSTGGGPQQPECHGTYLISCDDDGHDEYRVVFNEDAEGYYLSGPSIHFLDEDNFLFFYGYYFKNDGESKLCLTKVRVK